MGSRGCDGYGKEWEKGDPVCLDCPDEYSCRDRTLKRKRLILEKRKSKASSGDTVGGGSNRGVYSYPTNTKYLLPEEGESPVARIGKNMLAGGLSAAGGEIYAFFQEWRWPFKPTPVEKPKAEEERPKPKAKPTQQPKPKPKPKPRHKPAKRIVVDDFDDDDDELDIDLDDL